MRLAVVPVNDSAPSQAARMFQSARDWYADVSSGRCDLRIDMLPAVNVGALGRFSTAGGLSPQPPNSRTLLQIALDGCDPPAHARIAACGGRVALWVSGRFRPHVWSLQGAGFALGGQRWVTKYAILPQSAPLGTVVHELGHLMLGWADGAASARAWCLMAQGGHTGDGAHPAPPCAPLQVQAGWRDPVPLTGRMTLQSLSQQGNPVLTRALRGRDIMCEFRGTRILVWSPPWARPELLWTRDLEHSAALPILGLLSQAFPAHPRKDQAGTLA